MRPARSGCLNCQWLPRTATRTQPSRSSSRISLRLSRSTPIQCVAYYTTGPVPHRVFRAQSGGDHTPTRDEEPNRPGAPQRDPGRPHRGSRARSPTSSSSTTSALPGAPRTLQRGRRRPGQPVLSPAEARKLLESIGTGALAGLRDRALLSVMLYSFARVSAVLGMRRQDYFGQGSRGWLRLHEKGGKRHDVPAHHRAMRSPSTSASTRLHSTPTSSRAGSRSRRRRSSRPWTPRGAG